MTDYFAILGLPRLAALSETGVRAAFQRQGSLLHPDNALEEREAAAEAFQKLNTAQAVLGRTATRLQHLVDLFTGERQRGGVLSETLLGLFSEIGPTLQRVDGVLTKFESARSVLAKALLSPRVTEAAEVLEGIGAKVTRQWQILEGSLPALDEALAENPAPALPELQKLSHEAAFLAKWDAQIQQRRLRLAEIQTC